MRKTIATAMLVAMAVSTAGLMTATAQESPWLHVRVTEHDDGTSVAVNLPLSVVEVALDIAEREIRNGGHLHLDDDDVDVARLRRAWSDLRSAGDADFVTIEEDDENIRIAREGDRMVVDITDASTGDQKGHVEVPVNVVDVLLAGDGDELDIRGALQELVRSGSGEIVVFDDDDSSVRVWIE